MDNATSVNQNDTDSVDEILVPWVSSNDSYDPTIYRFWNGFQGPRLVEMHSRLHQLGRAHVDVIVKQKTKRREVRILRVEDQNLSIPSSEVEDDTADIPVLFSVRLAIMIGVISGIFILAWASLSLHRKRIKDSKKRKQRKETLL